MDGSFKFVGELAVAFGLGKVIGGVANEWLSFICYQDPTHVLRVIFTPMSWLSAKLQKRAVERAQAMAQAKQLASISIPGEAN